MYRSAIHETQRERENRQERANVKSHRPRVDIIPCIGYLDIPLSVFTQPSSGLSHPIPFRPDLTHEILADTKYENRYLAAPNMKPRLRYRTQVGTQQ